MTVKPGPWVAGSIAALVACSWLATPASAAARDHGSAWGWWAQTAALGAGPTTAFQTPANGLFVAGSTTHPTAISAVAVTEPAHVVPTITLGIVGTPLLPAPPEACALTSTFRPVEGGAWSGRPTWNCKHAVIGVINTAKTTVTFRLVTTKRGGTVGVVVLPSVVTEASFAEPLFKRSVVRSPATPARSAASTRVHRPRSHHDRPANGHSSTEARGNSVGPPVQPPAYASSQAEPGRRPQLAGTTSAPAIDTQTAVTPTAAVRPVQSWRRRLTTGSGMAVLVALIAYWTEGFGAFRWRHRRLAVPSSPRLAR